MIDAQSQSAITPFWRYSLKFYGQSGVSDACIALQDGFGVDVNLLLYLFWLASEGRQLTADEVKALDDKVKAVELEAERMQQEALYQFTRSGPPLGKAAEPPAAARGNIAALAGALGKTFPKASVDVLIGGFTGAA